MSAQLTYQVAERKLKSENHLTLDQLTLGQKVESADATRLPVRLAIALLKDRDGRIALDLPVNGSLDDPQFNLGKVVYRAIETVLARIVTSPFSALGALFGGKGEELSFQEFQPGSTNLLPAAIAKLDVLANGLYARPELQLEIEGSADPLDRPRGIAPREIEQAIAGATMGCRRERVPCRNQSRRHRKPARSKFPESVGFRQRRLRPQEPSGILVRCSHQIRAHRKLSRRKVP